MWLHVPGISTSRADTADSASPSARAGELSRKLRARTMTRAEWAEVYRWSRSLTWSATFGRPAYLLRAFATEPSLRLLSGLTCAPSTVRRGAAAWMDSWQASPASPTRSPGTSSGPTTSATSGRTWSDSYAPPDPAGDSLRTWAEAFGTSTPASAPTLKALATASRRRSSRLRTWVRRTVAPVSSSSPWPTPRAQDNDQGETARQGVAEAGSSWRGQHRGATTTTAAMMWPTPRTSDTKASGARDYRTGHAGTTLTDQTARSSLPDERTTGNPSPASGGRRYLNPSFVEWLMGLPAGWTSLGALDCTCLETAWSRCRPQLHSLRSPGGQD